MAGSEPGERPDPGANGAGRRLERAPGERYAAASGGEPGDAGGLTPLTMPLAKAVTIAIAGAAGLFAVGAVFASTAGLLFVAGLAGGAIGLVLARAAVPAGDAGAALPRRRVAWLAIGVAVAAVVAGALLTWLYARGEGGTLGIVDYLIETFGPLVPAELAGASLAAAWGANAGPVQG